MEKAVERAERHRKGGRYSQAAAVERAEQRRKACRETRALRTKWQREPRGVEKPAEVPNRCEKGNREREAACKRPHRDPTNVNMAA